MASLQEEGAIALASGKEAALPSSTARQACPRPSSSLPLGCGPAPREGQRLNAPRCQLKGRKGGIFKCRRDREVCETKTLPLQRTEARDSVCVSAPPSLEAQDVYSKVEK